MVSSKDRSGRSTRRPGVQWVAIGALMGLWMMVVDLHTSSRMTTFQGGYESDEDTNDISKITVPTTTTSVNASNGHDVYQLAREESLGFFTNIREEDWLLRKEITHRRAHVGLDDPRSVPSGKSPAYWYQLNWDPDFACFFEDVVGGNDDGHKWVCDPHRLLDKDDCLVYSFGSNGQIEFEKHLKSLAANCEIHVFDPIDFREVVEGGVDATFHQWGLGTNYQSRRLSYEKPDEMDRRDLADLLRTRHDSRNVVLKRKQVDLLLSQERHSSFQGGTFKTLQNTMKELGHEGRRIDIFKIDCEGCELRTYKDFVKVDLRQILVEVHDFSRSTHSFFNFLHSKGYVMFHKEPNIMWASGNCVEFSFLKMNETFFEHAEDHLFLDSGKTMAISTEA